METDLRLGILALATKGSLRYSRRMVNFITLKQKGLSEIVVRFDDTDDRQHLSFRFATGENYGVTGETAKEVFAKILSLEEKSVLTWLNNNVFGHIDLINLNLGGTI
jgi:hypothetical protein